MDGDKDDHSVLNESLPKRNRRLVQIKWHKLKTSIKFAMCCLRAPKTLLARRSADPLPLKG
eukprot:8372138-Prorocentrum_lima.AAC.1